MQTTVKIKKFRDKHTKKVYREGDVYKGTEERIAELAVKGWVEPIKEKTVLDGTIDEIKEVVAGLEQADVADLLEKEKAGKARKRLIEFLESLLEEEGAE